MFRLRPLAQLWDEIHVQEARYNRLITRSYQDDFAMFERMNTVSIRRLIDCLELKQEVQDFEKISRKYPFVSKTYLQGKIPGQIRRLHIVPLISHMHKINYTKQGRQDERTGKRTSMRKPPEVHQDIQLVKGFVSMSISCF